MIVLRDVTENDLPVFFENQCDERAIEMTGFPARDEKAFFTHWKKIMLNENGVVKTIVADGNVAGNMLCYDMEGEQEVGYWLGREYWGKGIATEALKQFLGQIKIRPLSAHVAKQNPASKRVLEKCGFVVIGEDTWSPAPGAKEIPEFILRLE
jgi:RimJ/RimL family protein N-acetyltransferase